MQSRCVDVRTGGRYLNNPEIIGGTSWFGLALISGSYLTVGLAVLRHLSYWWFLSSVEKYVVCSVFFFLVWTRLMWNDSPHMRKLYGDSLRKEAGFVKVMKNVASRNARILELSAPRHAPEIKRVAREVKGTFDKVYGETADAVEEFLAKCKSKATYPSAQHVFLIPSCSETTYLGGHARYEGSVTAVSGEDGHNVRVLLRFITTAVFG